MRRMVLAIGLATLVMACGDTGVTDLSPNGASRVIQDANTGNGGNAAFFWLPPIVKNPLYAGVFNPLLKPTVVICALGAPDAAGDQACVGDPLASYTMSDGTDGNAIAVSTADQHYKVNWQTKNYTLDSSTTYRIQVFLTTTPGSERLGFADVVFADNMQAAKNLTTGDEIALVDGSTLPIVFRIEEGVSCNGETDCGEASIGPAGGTVTTAAGFAGTELPAGAVDGDVLITIRRIDPATQPWGRCLPTGLRQEEGCYEFDTEPALSKVQTSGEDRFNVNVLVGVCLDPQALREDRLALHKYDPEKPADGVVELAGAPETFLTCDGFAYDEPTGLFGRFASAARRLLRPVASVIAVRPLYATDEGRGGVTDSYSFIGWAEPVDLTVSSAPVAVLPGAPVPATVSATTGHNHTQPELDASGHTLRFDYVDPAAKPAALGTAITDATGLASPVWTLTEVIGVHTVTVTTRMEIDLAGQPFLVPDPTTPLQVVVGGYQSANACDGNPDCGQAIVDAEGETLTTENGFAGTEIPPGALDNPVLITIRRVDPATQPWGDCLPTGLRQEEGCYEFDTEPALSQVQASGQDKFNTNVLVAVCIDPQATRQDRLRLHKFDPDQPAGGVVELQGAPESFLTCDAFAYENAGFLGRFAYRARRILTPVATTFIGKPLYATDEGRGGVTDSYSFIGWAEPILLSVGSVPVAVQPSTALSAPLQAMTGHNHGLDPVNASGHTLRLVYTDPAGTVSTLAAATTDAAGQAVPSWTLTGAVGKHTLTISTRRVVGGVEIPDPTGVLTVAVGGYTTAGACANDPDCVQAVVDETGDTVTTSTGFAGTVIPPGALDGAVLVTIRRIDPDQQPWGDCLPTGLRQEEGCYEFDTEPALADVNQQDKFNVNVEVAVCLDPAAVRPDRLTLHKFDPDKPAGGVVELAGAPGDFITCGGFASIPNGLFQRLAHAGRRLFGPIASQVAPRPLYAALTDEGRGGVTDSYSFIGWAEPVTLALTTGPNALDPSITDVVVTAQTAHNHGLLPEPADGATLRFEYTDPSGNVTVSNPVTAIASSAAQARIPLTTQGGTHNVRVSTQQEIIIDSDLLIATAAGAPGLFAAPRITIVGVPTDFVVPDPTVAVESGPLTVLGLVSRWDADGAGDPFADRVGPNHGTPSGTVDATNAAGVQGSGFRFDGTGGEVVAPAAHIGAAGQFSVALWYKLDPAGSPWEIQRFVTLSGSEGEKAVLRQDLTNSGHAARLAHFYGGFGEDPNGWGFDLVHIRVGSELFEGCWRPLVATYDGSAMRFYSEGNLRTTVTVDPTVSALSHVAEHIAFSSALAAGEGVEFPEALTGTLDDIEVYNYALSAAEVGAFSGRHAFTCDATTGLIAGVVRHADTREPLGGVTVTVDGSTLSTVTDAGGHYVIRGVPLGTQTVVGTLNGFQEARQTVEVADVGRTTGADHLNMTPVLVGSLTGVLTDRTTDAALEGAEVTYSPDVAAVLTDAQGAFRIDDIPAGGQTFTFARAGYHSETWFTEIVAGATPNIAFELFPVVNYAASATDPAGDAGDGPDMLGGSASTDGLRFTFSVRVANDAVTAAGVWAQWNLDLDANGATGYQMSDTSVVSNTTKVGAEYLLTMAGGTVLLHRWAGSSFVLEPQDLTVTIVDDDIGRTFSIRNLLNYQLDDDGRMRVNIITAKPSDLPSFDAVPADYLDSGAFLLPPPLDTERVGTGNECTLNCGDG